MNVETSQLIIIFVIFYFFSLSYGEKKIYRYSMTFSDYVKYCLWNIIYRRTHDLLYTCKYIIKTHINILMILYLKQRSYCFRNKIVCWSRQYSSAIVNYNNNFTIVNTLGLSFSNIYNSSLCCEIDFCININNVGT